MSDYPDAAQTVRFSFGRHLPAVLLIVCCAIWMIPNWSAFTGHPTSDMPDHVWGNQWFAQQLWNGQLPTHTLSTHYPSGGRIWHIDPIGGLLTAIIGFVSPQLEWNLILALQLCFSGVVGYGFFFSQLQKRALSLMLALMLLWSPYNFGLLHSGLSEYLGTAPLIAVLWALSKNRVLLTGVLLGLCGWQAFYYAVFGGLAVLCWNGRAWRSTAISSVIGAILVLPAYLMARYSTHAEDAAFTVGQAPSWSNQAIPAIDLLSWIRPGEWYHPDTPALGNPGILQVNYVGWLPLLLLFWGVIKSTEVRSWCRRWWLIWMLALGPKLSINRWLPLGGMFFLPMVVLYLPGSPFVDLHHPYRVVALLFPLMLVGIGKGLLQAPLWLLIALLAAWRVEVEWSPAPTALPFTELSEDVSMDGPRLDWPPDFSTGNRRYLLQNVSHQQPIAAGVNQFLGRALLMDPGVQRWLSQLDNPLDRTKNRDQAPLRGILRGVGSSTSRLPKLGFRWLVLHHDFLSQEELRQTHKQLRAEWGEPILETEKQTVYRLADG